MKPFLLLQSRPEDAASDNEYAGFLAASGLSSSQLERFRVEAAPLPEINLDRYSGIIVGGGPYNTSDPEETKSDTQKRVEADFARLLPVLIARDFPFFGACYGIGTLGKLLGGTISRTYAEPVAPVLISLTTDGRNDPLLADIPDTFEAIVGHKEACESLPPGAVHLASSPMCPMQMFRVKKNLYVTQFHPELDMNGLRVRVGIYKNAGYFPPEDADKVISGALSADLSYAPLVLRAFAQKYKQV
ncbi:MAG: glutamine amidotransferase [Candidatus Saccharibacteria bacterium]|nr:glutamine amidotransferase [Candidatus Saccharibacteria bacterium]